MITRCEGLRKIWVDMRVIWDLIGLRFFGSQLWWVGSNSFSLWNPNKNRRCRRDLTCFRNPSSFLLGFHTVGIPLGVGIPLKTGRFSFSISQVQGSPADTTGAGLAGWHAGGWQAAPVQRAGGPVCRGANGLTNQCGWYNKLNICKYVQYICI